MAHIYEKKSLKMTSLHIVYDRGGLYDKEGEYLRPLCSCFLIMPLRE